MRRQSVIKSLAFKFTERVIVKALGLIISIVLARLLAPEQFGLIAIVLVFIDLSQTFVQGGLNTALVQNKDTSEDDYSTVFYISLIVAIALIGALWGVAPFIDKYYDNIGLVSPLRIYSFALVFSAINSIQVAKMQREMKFKQMMICTTVATILSGCIGIFAAYNGCGIWALIAYYFSNTIVSCITMLKYSDWRPKLVFSKKRAAVLYAYGWKMLVSSVLCSLYNNLRSLVIGKMFSQKQLGYYNRGQQFPDIIGNTLDVSIQSVMFPVLSSVQDDKLQVKALLKKSIALGSYIIFPAMCGLAGIAQPLVSVLLTDKWLPCVIFLQIIAIGNTTIPLTSSNLVAIKSIGRSDVYMKLEIVRRIAMLMILAISALVFKSVLVIAYGYVFSSFLDYLIIGYVTKKLIGYGILQQIKGFWKSAVAAVIMFIVIRNFQYLHVSSILILIIQVASGTFIYLIITKLLKSEELDSIITLIKSKFVSATSK